MAKLRKEVHVHLNVEPSKIDILPNEPITGRVTVKPSDKIQVEALTVHVEAFYSTYELKNGALQEIRTPFFSTPPTVLLQQPQRQIFLLPQETHFPFTIQPLQLAGTPSSCLPDKIRVSWFVITQLTFPKAPVPLSHQHEFRYRTGNAISCLNSPDKTILSKQSFLTHPPINYRVALHKTSYISEETLSMRLDIKNGTRMEVVRMKIELRQKWVSKRKSEVINCFKLELNSAPLFPVGPREEREKTILFPFPKHLHPTIFATPNKKTSMVTVSYELAFEFATCKNDIHQIIVPINIEDNYPPRNPEDPPKPRELPPTQYPQNTSGYPQMPPQPMMSMPIIPDVRVDMMAMQTMQPIQTPPMGSFYPGLSPQYPLYPQGSFQGSFGGNMYDQQFYPAPMQSDPSNPMAAGVPREEPPAYIPLNQIPVMSLPNEPASGTGLYPVIPGFEPFPSQSFNPELHFAEMQSKMNDTSVPQ